MNHAEAKVMEIFRFYGVLPYQMLCLNGKIQQELRQPLSSLIQQGFIVREGRHDAYHLTATGYEAVSQLVESG